MRTIRANIFETNSSSTHSVVLRPIDMDMIKAAKNGRFTFGAFPFCEEKKMLVLDKEPGFEFGIYEGFYEKLNYVVCLLLYRHYDELFSKKRSWDDDNKFTTAKGNLILNTYYKDFIEQIAKYASGRYKIDCKTIGYLPKPGKGGRMCTFHFDHEVLNDTDENNLHLREDLVRIVTTEGLAIKYEFS